MKSKSILLLSTIDSYVHTRKYSQNLHIADVKVINLQRFVEEDGDFSEIVRLTPGGEIESVPGFVLSQMNRTKLMPGQIKAWHLHMRQDVLWYISPTQRLIAGLWDIRKDSPTSDKKMKIVLGDGQSFLLMIPRGVAHGSANFSDEPVDLYYFTNLHFDPARPDEKRIEMSKSDFTFWQPSRE